ncbi:MAG: ROK family protein [Methanospirillum sp.]|nr:ROK family protein [Methanospirillum sp.]
MLPAGAIDIGGTNTRVAIIGRDGVIIRMERCKTPAGNPGDIAGKVSDLLLAMTGGEIPVPLAVIGIAAAGQIDLKAGTLVRPPKIPFTLVPLVSPIRERTGLEPRLLNDCRAAVLGEVITGGGKNRGTVVYITISTGIGGGIFTGGRVMNGRGGNAGEIGHFPVDTTYLVRCTCGCSGHWEGYASGKGIPVFYQEWCMKNSHSPSSAELTTGEILSRSRGEQAETPGFGAALATINGRGLSAVIVAYDPDSIILDGPVIRNHPDLVEDAVRMTDRYLILPEICISPLEGDAPLIGAAMAVFYPDMIS